MTKIYFRSMFVLFLLSAVFIRLTAQTTLTTSGIAAYNGTNGLSANCFVTFVVENTNSYGIFLTGLEVYKSASYPSAAADFTLWSSTTSLSGSATITTPTWSSVATTSASGLVTGYNTIFSNLTLFIPAGAQYRYALQSSAGLAYSGSAIGGVDPDVISGGGVNLKLGEATVNGDYVGCTGAFPTTSNIPRWFTGSITFIQAPACSGTPVAGTITSTTGHQACNGTRFTLGLAGSTAASGLSYQWQSSANGTSFTNITNATNAVLDTSQLVSRYYRAVVKCGTNTATSDTFLITTPNLVSGSFTINSAITTGGSNFQNFTDAINYIKCGISGPVTLTVTAGSGPYTEQVTIPQVYGVSATNRIIINGNGRTLNFNSTNTNERAGIKLDGADYVTIDNLMINGTGSATTDYNFGVQLLNDANFNNITNCTITTINSSTSANFAGIVINGSATSATAAGTSGNGNTISGNTISGGYYGITNVGTSTTVFASNNRITNNTITDFYFYGVYMIYTSGTLVEGNDINRRNRSTSLSSFYGIYLSTSNLATTVSKNRIHDPFTALTTASTSIAAGIYLTGADARRDQENIISNNLVYNFTNGGVLYGMYNSSSDSSLFYHNTIALDDSSYTGTSIAYGFYQVTLATGIQLKNNLFRITRSGTATKYGLYFATATSPVTSNNNDIVVAGSGGIYNTGYTNATAYASLADWQSGSGQDVASLAINPLFTAPATGNYRPTATALDNKGATIAGITTDITNLPRSSTTPDMGAFEFGPPLPIKLLSLAAAKTGKDVLVSWTATAEQSFSHYEIEWSADGNAFAYLGRQAYRATGSTTNNYSFMHKDGTLIPFGTVYYRLKMVDVDGRFSYSAVVAVRLKGNGVEMVKTYPNPFTTTLYLQAESLTTTRLQATLADMTGRILLNKNYAVVSGSNVLVMDGLDKLQPGTYVLSMDMNGQKTTVKVVK